VSASAEDEAHLSDPACAQCHQTLDPMRNFYRQSYTYGFSQRSADPDVDAGIAPVALLSVPGGGAVMWNGVGDLATAIANHPRFAISWAQKLCQFANSSSCLEGDPEFQRVVRDFIASNYDFKELMADLFTSPLVTYASPTQTALYNGQGVTIARQVLFCQSLSNRMVQLVQKEGLADAGTSDLCGVLGPAYSGNRAIAATAPAIPSDGYARGQVTPVMPTEPNLFFQSATESICLNLASRFLTKPTADVDGGVNDFVTTLMGVPPSDARASPLADVLWHHYYQALASDGGNPTSALQSAFVLACESPTSISLGL
jgi:hypothetical protein